MGRLLGRRLPLPAHGPGYLANAAGTNRRLLVKACRTVLGQSLGRP
jgi:hypothetical protein